MVQFSESFYLVVVMNDDYSFLLVCVQKGI